MGSIACRTLWIGVDSQASSAVLRRHLEVWEQLVVLRTQRASCRSLGVPAENGGRLRLHVIYPRAAPPGGGFIPLQVVMQKVCQALSEVPRC